MAPFAWGRRVARAFPGRARTISGHFAGATAEQVMTVIVQPSDYILLASGRNAAGNGAINLLQHMPLTAASLGTTSAKLPVSL